MKTKHSIAYSFIYLGLFLILFSCNLAKEDMDIREIECSLAEMRSDFFFVSYYPDGGVKKKGSFCNLNGKGSWTAFYSDGLPRWTFTYTGEKAIYMNPERPYPQLFFEHDSLFVGHKTRFRAQGLLPFEELEPSDNYTLSRLEDDPEYDYVVTPIEEGVAHFFYTRKALVDDFMDYKAITDESKPSEEADKVFVNIYENKMICLAVMPIYDR